MSNADPDEQVWVQSQGFIADGHPLFVRVLNGLTAPFLGPWLIEGNLPSQVDHCLILMNRDGCAEVYVNELEIITETIVRRDIQAGEIVSQVDILGVARLLFPKVALSVEHGLIFYFNVGWRRGLFFDLRPNNGEPVADFTTALGKCYERLVLADLYGISDVIWEQLFDLGWFPFVELTGSDMPLLRRLAERLSEGKPVAHTEGLILGAFDDDRILRLQSRLITNPILQRHERLIKSGIDAYLRQDYFSAINNIWPRIEGVLQYAVAQTRRMGQKTLLGELAQLLSSGEFVGALFPQLFGTYLERYYFRDFDLKMGDNAVSRHSIGHGVADQDSYTQARALIGILMLDQLGHYSKRWPVA